MTIYKNIERNLEILIIKSRDIFLSLKQWRDQKTQLIAYYKSLIFKMPVFNKKGQGLIEYLIIIAIMAVASIGILRTLNQTVKAKFANSIYALQGKRQKASTESVRKTDYKKTDFSNFMTGAASNDKKNTRKSRNRRQER